MDIFNISFGSNHSFLKFICLDGYQKYIYPKIQQVDSAGLRLTNTGQNDHGKIWRDAVSSQLEHK